MLGKLLWQYLRRYWPLLLGVVGFQLLSALAALALPRLNASIIDQGVAKGDIPLIWSTGATMLVLSLGQIVASVIGVFFAARAAMGVGRDLRAAVFARVSGFSEREVSTFGAGSLITRNTNDVQQVQTLTMLGSTMLVNAPLLAVGGIVMALQQDVGLSWVLGITVPLLLMLAAFIISRMVPLFRRYQERLDAINRILREQLTGVRVVRAFAREPEEANRFREANTDLMVVGTRVGSLFVLLFPIAMLLMNLTVVAVIWFGGNSVAEGSVEIGTLFAFMQYVGLIMGGVLMASFMAMMIPRAAVSAERISEVLHAKTTLERPEHGVTVFPDSGKLAFRNVGFQYPGAAAPVLQNVSFETQPGQTVAIIGATGSGKTTLLSLIPRLFDATSGTVEVGGVDVRSADLPALWQTLGYVPQRPYLFTGTVAQTLRFGKEDATDTELWHALEIAQAADFVRQMPDGLQSRIAQGGTNVSGGQRQRLSIARALVPRPAMLLFDDSFSALDLATEARLRQALWRELPAVTKVVVAQRVSSVMHADQIVVLEGGTTVGIGTHEELLADNATYQEIVQSQLGVRQ